MFPPGDSPGPSFTTLLQRLGHTMPLPDPNDTQGFRHGTTIVAIRYVEGVVMAGDRRATEGHSIAHRAMEKVFPADRRSYLKRKYGMTIGDYDRMLEAQGGGCAICGRRPRADISLHVDHDHETARIRGILCFPCNNTLGDFKDDPTRLYAAANYLARDPELDTLIRKRAHELVSTRAN